MVVKGDEMRLHVRILILPALLLLGIALGCGTSSSPTPKPLVTDVYAAGFEVNDANLNLAKYWKNGTAVTLDPTGLGSIANSIAVSGNDVYVVGQQAKGPHDAAMLWKNGTPIPLSDGTNYAFATSVAVAGSDVYVAGYQYNAPPNPTLNQTGYWKNGVFTSLPDFGLGSRANSIFISGPDVYVAGSVRKTTGSWTSDSAVYWKNGTLVELTDGFNESIPYALYVNGGDVYVGAYFVQRNAPDGVATYWKNGTAVSLTNPNGAIAVRPQPLAPDANSVLATNQLVVLGSDVYVGGAYVNSTGNVVASVWKNGQVTPLTDGKNFASAFALTVVQH